MSKTLEFEGAGQAVVEGMGYEFPLHFSLCLAEDADEEILTSAAFAIATFLINHNIDVIKEYANMEDN
jgi:hypothetical protein